MWNKRHTTELQYIFVCVCTTSERTFKCEIYYIEHHRLLEWVSHRNYLLIVVVGHRGKVKTGKRPQEAVPAVGNGDSVEWRERVKRVPLGAAGGGHFRNVEGGEGVEAVGGPFCRNWSAHLRQIKRRERIEAVFLVEVAGFGVVALSLSVAFVPVRVVVVDGGLFWQVEWGEGSQVVPLQHSSLILFISQAKMTI